MLKRNKIMLIGVIVAIVIVTLGLVFNPLESITGATIVQEPIKIGVIGIFSGEYANYGIPMKNAVELAIEETNSNIELIFEDDTADSTKAASGMNKLINVDNVDYIISAQGSGQTSVVSPIAQSNSKILMITLGSAPGLTENKNYVFRSIPSDVYQANKMVDFIENKLQSEKVAGLYVNDAYGVGIKNIINENIKTVGSEMFEASARDFRTQLLKIKESDADTLVIAARRNEFPIILKQINELKLDVKIIASENFKDEEVLIDAGDFAEGVYLTFMDEPQDYLNFNSNYKVRFNEEPSAYSMYAYDGTVALLKAIEKDNVKEELGNIQFSGASGLVGFDNEGDRTGTEYIIYVVRNGQFVPF